MALDGMDQHSPGGRLLAVDVGLRTGLALFEADGGLVFVRSHNYGAQARLKAHLPGLLAGLPGLARLVLEGGRPLATLWEKRGRRMGLDVLTVQAETWRAALLKPGDRVGGEEAKRAALILARRIIREAGAGSLSSLTMDAAEAVCLGWWALGKRFS